jgi:hypothetical protein
VGAPATAKARSRCARRSSNWTSDIVELHAHSREQARQTGASARR